MSFSLGEYQDIFLEEADEQLQELNESLLKMEKDAEDEETINSIFRAAHSLKSSAAFVGLNDLSELAHKMENLLQGVRDKTMRITPEIIDLLFKCFDNINAVIGAVSEGRKPDADLSGIIREIAAAAEKAKQSSGSASSIGMSQNSGEKKDDVNVKTSFNDQEKKALKKGLDSGLDCLEITVFIENDAPMKWAKAHLILNNLKNIGQIIKTIPDENNLTDSSIKSFVKFIILTDDSLDVVNNACDIDLVYRIDVVKISLLKKDNKYILTFGDKRTLSESSNSVEEFVSQAQTQNNSEKRNSNPEVKQSPVEKEQRISAQVASQTETQSETKKDPANTNAKRNAPVLRTVKVSVDKLDDLLNNVGELVIANSGFFKLYEELKKFNTDKALTNEFKNRMEQMARIAKDLQSGIMKTRMVPIGEVFSRFQRLIRDLSKEVNKKVQLVTKGEDTELDKKVIDVIGEPLMHMIRNSVDHGIESPEDRAKQGKADLATVTLSAYQGGNQIYVEVIDDGKGLNIEAIKRKAIARELTTAEALVNMDDNDIYNFIFQAGFSTAETITDVSGRGVGMNVVKEVVQEMGGSITIESELGVGTKFIMAFPLTLAIIPAIMVVVKKETYAIPLTDVIETINIDLNDITTIEGHEVINLRGEILSLLRLSHFVGVDKDFENENEIPVIVVGYANRKIGLLVDKIDGKLEIVIKSLDMNYMNVEGLAGASILGDGSISLILDVSSMISKVINEQEKLSREDKKSAKAFKRRDAEPVAAQPPVVMQKPKIEPSRAVPERSSVKKEPEILPSKSTPTRTISQSSVSTTTRDLPIRKEPEKPVERKPIDDPDLLDKNKTTARRVEAIVKKVETMKEEKPIEVKKEVYSKEALYSKQTSPVQAAAEEDVSDKVKEALKNFRSELKDNVDSNIKKAEPIDHIKKNLAIEDDDIKKIHVMANVGITQAADSLSKIVKKRIDLAIPQVRLLPNSKVTTAIGSADEKYIGVYMNLSGDISGKILLAVPEESAFTLIDDLYNLENGQTKSFDEDGNSALREVTNIVGSSVINSFAERTAMSILPTVPIIIQGGMAEIISKILPQENLNDGYALLMETDFYYQDDQVVGHLLILPDVSSIKKLVENLREDE